MRSSPFFSIISIIINDTFDGQVTILCATDRNSHSRTPSIDILILKLIFFLLLVLTLIISLQIFISLYTYTEFHCRVILTLHRYHCIKLSIPLSSVSITLVSFILQTLNIDIVDKFLLELDTFDADNCKPGTETLLSEGVVQQYGRTRFRFVWRIIVFLQLEQQFQSALQNGQLHTIGCTSSG